jgi:SAM-dependent methyltransferase
MSDYERMWEQVYGDLQEVGPAHRHLRRIVRRVLAPLEYASALDVGCGAGHNLPLLARGRRLERLVGADVAEAALERARERAAPGGGSVEFVRLDVERQALAERFDLVFSSLVLEHLPDDEAALANLRAMARRDVVVATIAGDFERYRAWDEAVGHVRNYRRGELEAKLEAAGFGVQRAVYWGFPLYSPLVRRLQNRTSPQPSYRAPARALAGVLYWAYFLNSWRRGDLLVVHATT